MGLKKILAVKHKAAKTKKTNNIKCDQSATKGFFVNIHLHYCSNKKVYYNIYIAALNGAYILHTAIYKILILMHLNMQQS